MRHLSNKKKTSQSDLGLQKLFFKRKIHSRGGKWQVWAYIPTGEMRGEDDDEMASLVKPI